MMMMMTMMMMINLVTTLTQDIYNFNIRNILLRNGCGGEMVMAVGGSGGNILVATTTRQAPSSAYHLTRPPPPSPSYRPVPRALGGKYYAFHVNTKTGYAYVFLPSHLHWRQRNICEGIQNNNRSIHWPNNKNIK